MKASNRIIWVGLGMLVWGVLSAQARADQPLFSDETPLEAVLTAPLAQAYDEKAAESRFYLDGIFSYKVDADTIERTPVKIKTRGNFRRANCSLPPLRLNFSQKRVKDTLLDGQDKLKLVSPCRAGRIYQDLIGMEYLAYNIFQVVSEHSLKTRMMNLNYVDLDGQLKPRQVQAFVIEDIKDLAKRSGLKSITIEKASRRQMNLQATALVEVFAYFIGNNDYSTLIGMPGDNCCHNVRLLAESEEAGNYIPVPYDFDMSGLVDAPYATPPGTVPISSVRQRYFNGWCKSDEDYAAAVDRFREKEADIMALVDNAHYIRDGVKKRTKEYFEKFYSMMDSPKRYEREILGRCRGSKPKS